MSTKDSLGDRLKDREGRSQTYLIRRAYTLIRIDGKAFHSYTRGFKRPFDDDLRSDMQRTTLHLCKNIQGCVMGYTQSDEITLLLTDFETPTTDAWFDGNIQKITSIVASMTTAQFNKLRVIRTMENVDETASCVNAALALKFAEFDARCWSLSDPWDVYNTFLWRQQDATRNAIQMVARSLASHKECDHKNMAALQDLIHERGQNFNYFATDCKRGAFVVQDAECKFFIDKEPPILTQDKAWFFSKLPLLDAPTIPSKVLDENGSISY